MQGSVILRFTNGDCPGNLSLGQHTGDGKLDGETFLGRTWRFFFLGGKGEGKRDSRARVPGTFSQDDTSSKPLGEGGPRSSISLGRHVRCSSFDNPST